MSGGKKCAEFRENCVYSTTQVGQILGRSEKTVRSLCRRKVLRARLDRAGYLISGWAIRDYVENRCVCD